MKKIKILLVEDVREEADLFKDQLEDLELDNWVLHTVENGLEAKKALQREYPYENFPYFDLVFLDLNMPKMSGEELLFDLRKVTHWWKGYPVIVMLSNYDFSRKKIRNLYELGAASFLPKPKNFDEFKNIMDYWLKLVKIP